MKKNILFAGLVCTMLLSGQTVCAHTHTAIGDWKLNLEEHWHLCECGERLDIEAHTLEEFICTGCGSDVMTFEDGTGQVASYNESGACTFSAYYNADGIAEFASEYAYNEDGSWMSEKAYNGDVLSSECEYAVDEQGIQKMIKSITYNIDGSWVGMEYDVFENLVIEIYSDAEGNVELERRYEHTYDEENHITLTKTFENGVLTAEMEFLSGSEAGDSWSKSGKSTVYHEDGSRTVSESDPEGTWSTEITYDKDGNVTEEIRYEYLFDENGNSNGSKGYKNGKLFMETEGIQSDKNGVAMGLLWTEYHEDGTKTVTEYDEYFKVVKKTVYDKDGKEIDSSKKE